ncbi:hypothetical protein ACIQC7_35065 [Kitasatospora sp. NPDC088556]
MITPFTHSLKGCRIDFDDLAEVPAGSAGHFASSQHNALRTATGRI